MKKILIAAVFFSLAVLSLVVYGTEVITKFSDESTEKAFTFSTGGEQTAYFAIPQNSEIESAFLNMTGSKSKDVWSNCGAPAGQNHCARGKVERSFLVSGIVNGKIYLIGGIKTDGTTLDIVEEYDPATNSFTNCGNNCTPLPKPRSHAAACIVNNKIYVIGGLNSSSGPVNFTEEYSPTEKVWRNKKEMPSAREGIACAVVNNKIYVISGRNDSGFLNIVEEYDPATDNWTNCGAQSPGQNNCMNISTPRAWFSASSVGNRIYVTGGKDASYNTLSSTEEYDPLTNVWTTKSSMSAPRSGLTTVSVYSKVYAIEGDSSRSVEEYDPTSGDPWTSLTPSSTARTGGTSAIYNNKIYIFGGSDSTEIGNITEEYIPPSYPFNPWMDIGNDNDKQWEYSGYYNVFSKSVPNFSSEMNSFLPACDCSGCSISLGKCRIPVIIHSSSGGTLTANNINITLKPAAQIPNASIVSIEPEVVNYGDVVSFTGSGTPPEGKQITSYEWNSSIDGFLSSQQTFKISNLSVGIHTIYLRVKDNTSASEQWSLPITNTLRIDSPRLGSPVKVVPRHVTQKYAVQAFNVPAYYPNYQCYVSSHANTNLCTSVASQVETCTASGMTKPRLQFILNDFGKNIFTIGTSYTVQPVIRIGSLKIITPTSYGKDTPYNYGTLQDADFLPNGYYLPITTDSTIASEPENNRGVFYQLYRVKNCDITPVGIMKTFNTIPGQQNYFYTYVPLPLDCTGGEFCTYIGEILLLNGKESGGSLFTFSYGKMTDTLELTPAILDMGNATTGDTINRTVLLTNNGATSVSSLTITSTSSIITATSDKTTLGVGQSASLSIKLSVPQNYTTGTYTAYLNITASASGNKTITVAYPIIYIVNIPSGTLQVAPTTVFFGTLRPGDTASSKLSVKNTGTGTISGLTAITPSEIVGTFVKTNLSPGESTDLDLKLTVPARAENKNYQDEVIVTASGITTQTVTISTSYSVTGSTTAGTGITITPPSWNIGSVAPSSENSKIFQIVYAGSPQNVKVSVRSDVFSISSEPAELDLDTGNEITVTLVAPSTAGDVSGKFYFDLKKDNATLGTQEVSVSISVKEDNQKIIEDGKSRYTSLDRQLKSLEVQIGPGSKLSKELQQNITNARVLMNNAKKNLDDAESALSSGDVEKAKEFVSKANEVLSDVDETIRLVQSHLSGKQTEAKQNIMPIVIVLGIAGIFGGGIAALREGWVSLEKYPQTIELMKKLHLGFLVETAEKFEPKLRFESPDEFETFTTPAEEKPKVEKPKPELSQEELKAKWEEYYKKHPEYAKQVQEMYRNYYARRYK